MEIRYGGKRQRTGIDEILVQNFSTGAWRGQSGLMQACLTLAITIMMTQGALILYCFFFVRGVLLSVAVGRSGLEVKEPMMSVL